MRACYQKRSALEPTEALREASDGEFGSDIGGRNLSACLMISQFGTPSLLVTNVYTAFA